MLKDNLLLNPNYYSKDGSYSEEEIWERVFSWSKKNYIINKVFYKTLDGATKNDILYTEVTIYYTELPDSIIP